MTQFSGNPAAFECRMDRDDELRLFLVANGYSTATASQELYELAWENRIRPVNEWELKRCSPLDTRRFGYGRRANN